MRSIRLVSVCHSTEMLLMHLLYSLYRAIDLSEVILLALFYVSAAFDTVDHDILLECLPFLLGSLVFLWPG